MSPAVEDMLAWVREITGGTAAPIINELLVRDSLCVDPKRETFAILVDESDDDTHTVMSALVPSIDVRLALIAECLAALNIGFEVLGWDALNRRQHIAWTAPDEDAERIAILIAGGCGARLTTAVRNMQPRVEAELYYAGSGGVMGVITDGPPVCPVTDPQRAFEKAVRAKTMIAANNASGKDTRVEISIVENASDPDADVIPPLYGVEN